MFLPISLIKSAVDMTNDYRKAYANLTMGLQRSNGIFMVVSGYSGGETPQEIARKLIDPADFTGDLVWVSGKQVAELSLDLGRWSLSVNENKLAIDGRDHNNESVYEKTLEDQRRERVPPSNTESAAIDTRTGIDEHQQRPDERERQRGERSGGHSDGITGHRSNDSDGAIHAGSNREVQAPNVIPPAAPFNPIGSAPTPPVDPGDASESDNPPLPVMAPPPVIDAPVQRETRIHESITPPLAVHSSSEPENPDSVVAGESKQDGILTLDDVRGMLADLRARMRADEDRAIQAGIPPVIDDRLLAKERNFLGIIKEMTDEANANAVAPAPVVEAVAEPAVEAVAEPAVEAVAEPAVDDPESPGEDHVDELEPFHLDAEILAESRSPREKARGNIEAIRLVKEINLRGDAATRDEKIVLARYAGWGGIPDAFRSIDGTVKDGWGDIVAELESVTTDNELAEIRRTTLDAHYTSNLIVSAMDKGVRALGLDPRAILEPSVGTGNFIGLSSFPATRFTAVEIDPLTSSIARVLYPEARVITDGFHRALHKTGPIYDLVIGNPPFSDMRLVDRVNEDIGLSSPNTHTYFFNKSMEKLAPGGIMAMVVSRFLMDSMAAEPFRRRMAEKADLIAGFRLPRTAFTENAGTQVVTDVLFFQKRHELLDLSDYSAMDASDIPVWIEAGPTPVPMAKGDGEVEVTMSRYFSDEHPDHVLGRVVAGRGMYRDNELMVLDEEGWQARLISEVGRIHPLFDLPDRDIALLDEFSTEFTENDPYLDFPVYEGDARSGLFVLVDNPADPLNPVIGFRGALNGPKQRIGYTPVIVNDKEKDDSDEAEDEVDGDAFYRLSKPAYDRIRLYIPIRDAMMNLIKLQVTLGDSAEETAIIESARAELDVHYTAFVKKFGLLNRSFNIQKIRDDGFSYQVLALERDYKKKITPEMSRKTGEPVAKESAEKASIFTRRTQYPLPPIPDSAEDVQSAMIMSMNFKGRVDVAYISGLLGGRDWADIRAELGDRIALTDKGWEMSDAITSGDLVSRIEQLSNFANEHGDGMGEIDRTIGLLRKALPEKRKIDRITVNQGAHWIPLDITRQFIDKSFGEGRVIVNPVNSSGSWSVSRGVANSKGIMTYTTNRCQDQKMANYFLTRRSPVVVDTLDDDTTIVNEAETELARSKMDALIKSWNDWIKADPERSIRLEDAFDKKFNRFAPYKPFSDYLTFPGKSDAVKLRPTQKDGANRIIRSTGGVLIDHQVGAGKTFTLIAAIMESRRLGLVRKAIVTTPNGLEGQWVDAIVDLYPSANVLVTTKKDMSAKNRQKFLARIAVDDSIDIVVMPHSSFTLIPRDPSFDIEFSNEKVDNLMQSLIAARREAEENGAKKRSLTIKSIEKKLAREEEKIANIINRSSSADNGLHFGDLGIDMLVVDESQEFKNVSFETAFKSVGGLGNPDGSAKADDMLIKARMVIERGGKYVDASGTPESNTIAEVFLSQLKHSPYELKSMGLYTFDQWAAAFAEVTNEFQFTLTGAYKERAYLNKFVNMSQLKASIRSFRHTVTIEDVQRLAIEAGMPPVKIPRLEGGKPSIISVEKTPIQEKLIGIQVDSDPHTGDPVYNKGSILHQVANLPSGRPKKGDKNILSCISDLNKVSLSTHELVKKIRRDDPKLLITLGITDRDLAEETSPKLDACARRIVKKYHEWQEDKGTQLVFLDFSTPKKASKPSAETLMMRKMIADIELGERIEATEAEIAAREAAEEVLSGYTSSEIDDLLDDDASWTAYRALREQLISEGILDHEIAFIHDYDSIEKRDELFAKVRSGQVRILMGNTAKMGSGMNVQERMVGMHMLDAPWRPDQMDQRIGRMLRQGNVLIDKYGEDNFAVSLDYYVTRGSSDASRYQVLDNKKKFLDAIRVDDDVDVVEDPESAAFNPQAVMAEASGNTVLKNQAVIKMAITRASSLIQGVRNEKISNESRIKFYEREIDLIEGSEPDITNINAQVVAMDKAIAEARTSFEHRKTDRQAAVNIIREDHREFVAKAKEELKSSEEFKALTKPEREEKLREMGLLHDTLLIQKLKEVPEVGEGWFNITLPDGTAKEGLAYTDIGELIIDATNQMRRESKNSLDLFVIGDFAYSVSRAYSEISGTSNYVGVTHSSGSRFGEYKRAISLDDKPTQIAIRLFSLTSRILEENNERVRNIGTYRRSLEEIKSGGEARSISADLERLEFLKGSYEAAKSLMRCGIREWSDGAFLVDALDQGVVAHDAPTQVTTIMSGPMKKVAETLIPESAPYIRAWAENGENYINAIGSDQDIKRIVVAMNEDLAVDGADDQEKDVASIV